MIGLGIGVQYSRVLASIDTQAQAHYDRVIADGGIIPAGLLGCNAWFVAVKAVYGVTDITTAISAGYDPHYLGAKIGAGSGTTLGQAATKLYSCSGASGDLVQATAASMPLLLVKNSSDANYWFGSGVSGNYCSTPNAAANQITGDIEIISCAEFQNWTSAASLRTFVAKWNEGSATLSYGFHLTSTGLLNLVYSTSGSYQAANDKNSTIAVSFTANQKGWVKCTLTASTATIRFYTSTDGVNWTQLGTNVAASGTSIYNSSQTLNIGQTNDSSFFYPTLGKIYRATIANSIGGTPVVDFNPASYNASTSQVNWTSATGEVWTINTGTAATGYKGQVVTFTTLQGDGVDDNFTNALVRPNVLTQYLVTNTYTNDNSGNAVLIDSNSSSYLNSIVAFTSIVGNIMNGFASDLTKAKTANVLFLVTTSNNAGVKNSVSVNNGAETTNAYTPSVSGNGISMLSRSSGGTKANALISSYIISNSQDDSIEQTAMYNVLRNFKGNAF